MMPERLAWIVARAACFLAAGLLILWPFIASGRVGVFSFVLAAPFVLAGLAPQWFGLLIGKGLLVIAMLYAFYDPPSSIAFSPERFFSAVPFFVLGLLLALPPVLARMALKKQ
jgi:hypothetical protein